MADAGENIRIAGQVPLCACQSGRLPAECRPALFPVCEFLCALLLTKTCPCLLSFSVGWGRWSGCRGEQSRVRTCRRGIGNWWEQELLELPDCTSTRWRDGGMRAHGLIAEVYRHGRGRVRDFIER